ncbi:trypsin-like peptidase domain-containing protein [Streptomyces sp. NPDC041068]|uniref:trypsin-like serine peptidase n=1 Tax=Streptomyces sp. NPDC041068 TaxID=3155130 RepID=UPI0033FAAA94
MTKRVRTRRRRLRALLAVGALFSCLALANANALPHAVTPAAHPVSPAATARVGALFDGGLDGRHFCTASVVHSKDRDLIVTAGHCLSDGEGVTFAPGYHDGKAPYGLWTIDRVYADDHWTHDGDEDHDLAFAVLEPLDGRRVEDVTGANTLDTVAGTDHRVTVTGYPSDEDAPRTCTSTTNRFRAGQQSIGCPGFSNGTSGSPWVTADGHLIGVLGGYHGGGDTPDVSYSVILGTEAAALYAKATQR